MKQHEKMAGRVNESGSVSLKNQRSFLSIFSRGGMFVAISEVLY